LGVPDRRVVDEAIIQLYESLLAEEAQHQDRKQGLAAGFAMVEGLLQDKGMSYDELVFAL
jgi:hypothetical protein